MIDFLTEDVRMRFHSLPIDRQREWMSIANIAAGAGKKVTFLFVNGDDEDLEVSIRIDE